MNFDIVEVAVRAWKITWKYKVLWIFGMLASCGRRSGGNSSNSQSRTSNGQFPTDGPFTNEMIQQMDRFVERMGSWFEGHSWVIVAVIIFFLLWIILQIFFSVTGSIGLIRGAYQAETGVEQIHFGSLFGESLRYFWRVIGLGLTVYLPIILGLVGFFVVFIFFLDKTSPSSSPAFAGSAALLFLLGFCCCLVPLMLLLGLYYTQAIRALILEDLGVFKSLSRGWEIFRKNIGGLIVAAIIVFVINLVIGLIIAIPIYIAIFPVLIKLTAGEITSWRPFIIAITFVLCYSPIAWFLTGVLTTYTETIWTLIYMRVAQPKENAPISLPANA